MGRPGRSPLPRQRRVCVGSPQGRAGGHRGRGPVSTAGDEPRARPGDPEQDFVGPRRPGGVAASYLGSTYSPRPRRWSRGRQSRHAGRPSAGSSALWSRRTRRSPCISAQAAASNVAPRSADGRLRRIRGRRRSAIRPRRGTSTRPSSRTATGPGRGRSAARHRIRGVRSGRRDRRPTGPRRLANQQRDGRRDREAAADGRLTVRVFWPDLVPPCALAGEVGTILRARGWTGWPQRCGPGCGLREGSVPLWGA